MGQFGPAQEFASQAFYEAITTTSAFLDALYDPDAEFNIVVEMTGFLTDQAPQAFEPVVDMGFAAQTLEPIPSEIAVDPPVVQTRFSSRYLNWRPDDEYEPNGYAEVRLAKRSNIESSINLQPGTTNASALSVGAAIIDDKDHYIAPLRRKYNYRGRPVRLIWGPWLSPRKDYRSLLQTVAGPWTRDSRGQARMTFEDQNYRLSRTVQPRVYGGSGLLDGTPTILGKQMPIIFGVRRQIEPPIVDPSIRLRHVSDGSVTQINGGFYGAEPAIYDGDVGTVQELIDAALSNGISQGGFMSCNTFGCLIDRPAAGVESVFTIDVHGEGPTRPGELITHIMSRSGVEAFEIDIGSFAFMNLGECGYYFPGTADVTIKSIVEQLAISGGGRIAPDLNFRGLPLIPPEDQNFVDQFFEGEVEKMEYRGPLSRPVLEYLLRYNFADRVLAPGEILAPGNDPDAEALAQLEYEEFGEEAQLVRFKYQDNRIDQVIQNVLLNDLGAVQILQKRYRDFYAVPREVYSCYLPKRAMQRMVGDVIKLYSENEEAFIGGRNCTIVANRRELDNNVSRVHVLI